MYTVKVPLTPNFTVKDGVKEHYSRVGKEERYKEKYRALKNEIQVPWWVHRLLLQLANYKKGSSMQTSSGPSLALSVECNRK